MPDLSRPGWKRQPDDPDDWIYQPPANQVVPEAKDLRDTHHVPRDIYDQGDLSSCTANAIASALRYGKNAEAWGAQNVTFNPSRLFIYYHERILNATNGQVVLPSELNKFLSNNAQSILTNAKTEIPRAQIVENLKADDGADERYGFCWETTWPYTDDETDPSYYTPPPNALKEGLEFLNSSANSFMYYRIKDIGDGAGPNLIAHMETAIAEGYPVIFGFSASDQGANLDSDGKGLDENYIYTGWVQDGDTHWGHCVLAVGYDKDKQLFLILNSWGKDFGNGGYYYMPYRWFEDHDAYYLTDKDDPNSTQTRVDDFWVVKSNMFPAQPGILGSDGVR